jgi:hypothetical protein
MGHAGERGEQECGRQRAIAHRNISTIPDYEKGSTAFLPYNIDQVGHRTIPGLE